MVKNPSYTKMAGALLFLEDEQLNRRFYSFFSSRYILNKLLYKEAKTDLEEAEQANLMDKVIPESYALISELRSNTKSRSVERLFYFPNNSLLLQSA